MMLLDGNFILQGSSYLLEFTQEPCPTWSNFLGMKSQIPPGALKRDVPPPAIATPRNFAER